MSRAAALVDPLPTHPGTRSGAIKVDGRQRAFIVHVPKGHDGTKALPMLLVLHGGRSTGWEIRGFTRMDKVADREGFIAVYPHATENRWNDGRAYGENVRVDSGVDDVAFLRALIEVLCDALPVDRTRVYMTGASNGGMMAFRFACEAGDTIAGVAPVIASMPEPVYRAARPSDGVPVPIVIIAGTADPLVPWNGGDVVLNGMPLGRIVPVEDSVRFWVERNQCVTEPEVVLLPDLDPDDGMHVRVERYASRTGDADVLFYAVEGAGHTWPGGRQYMPVDVIGPTCRDMDGNAEVWGFLQSHAKVRNP